MTKGPEGIWMGDILRMPYRVASARVIRRLIEAGYLESQRRHDADAIATALDKLNAAPLDIFGRPDSGDDPPPTAA